MSAECFLSPANAGRERPLVESGSSRVDDGRDAGEQTGAVVVELPDEAPGVTRGVTDGGPHSQRHGDPVRDREADGRLERVAERVAEVQQPALTAIELVDLDEPPLDAEHVLDQLGRWAGLHLSPGCPSTLGRG